MAPEAENAPACGSECLGAGPIARDVFGDFACPVVPVVLGHATVPAAAVPKAAVNEEHETRAAEHKIRAAGQWLMSAPAGDAGGAEHRHQLQLRGFVAARADGGHDLGALFLGKDISHGDSESLPNNFA